LGSRDLEEVRGRATESKSNAMGKGPQLRSDRTHLPPDQVVIQLIARKAICYWWEQQLSKSVKYKPRLPASAMLPGRLVDLLAQKLHICTTYERFEATMVSWTHLEEWGTSLFELVGKIWQTFESETGASLVTDIQTQRKEHKAKRAANDQSQEEVAAGHVTRPAPLNQPQPSAPKRRRSSRMSLRASRGGKR
ncbi:hypothetical protein FRC10_003435, partial [Ceratobasidium sp. 414]